MKSTLVQWGLERAGGHAWLEWKLNKGGKFPKKLWCYVGGIKKRIKR